MSEQHYVYRIVRDEYPESPRDWDNLGVMACWSRRYSLGDVQPKVDIQDYLADLIGWDDDRQQAVYDYWFNRADGSDEERHTTARNKLEERIKEEFDKQFIGLELYLWDHSGLSMSSGPFEYPCDSSIFGIIYISRAKAREEFHLKRITRVWEDRIKGYLKGEVETFDQYLTGQVYGYRIFEVPEGVNPEELSEEEIEALEEVESCYGFYGEKDAEEEAKSNLAYFEEHHAERLFERQQAEYREAGQMELPLAA